MATSYLSKDGLLYFLQQIRPNATPQMDGTASTGTAKRFANQDHVHPSDTTKADKSSTVTNVSYNSTSKKIQKTINGTTSDVVTLATVATSGSYNDLSNKPTIPSAVQPTTTTPKMDGTAAVGSETKYAKGDHVHPSDTSRVPTTRKVNGQALSSDVELLGSDIQYDGGGGTAFDYGDSLTDVIDTVYGITQNVQADWSVTSTTSDAYIKNKPTLGTAAAKGVVTTISGDSANLPTVTAVKNYVETAITGAAAFQGTAPTTFAPTNYKKGYYWVVGTAGTYVGQVCEAGDMIFAIADYSSAYSASDFDVIQTNLDITAITNSEIDTIVAS